MLSCGNPAKNVNIQEIKNVFGIPKLGFEIVLNQYGDETSWLRAWNNDLRIEVIAHNELLPVLKSCDNLGYKVDMVISKNGNLYTKVTLFLNTRTVLEC